MLLKKLFNSLKKAGLVSTFYAIRRHLRTELFNYFYSRDFDYFSRRRVELGRLLEDQVGHSNVLYGGFSGLALPDNSTWGSSDRVSMMLGMYEKEVVDYLSALSPFRSLLVNVGAGDGYYCVGAVVAQKFSSAIAFEQSEKSQEAIRESARVNRVNSRIKILGKASEDFLSELLSIHRINLSETVFLFDVEGAEISLLSESNLDRMHASTIIVEMHPVQVSENAMQELEERAHRTHNVREITTCGRNPGDFIELKNWLDDDRWLICSEGRYRRGRWLVLESKSH